MNNENFPVAESEVLMGKLAIELMVTVFAYHAQLSELYSVVSEKLVRVVKRKDRKLSLFFAKIHGIKP